MKKIFLGTCLFACVIFLNAQTFEQLTKLVAADRSPGNQFGNAVAISGTYAVIGAADISAGQIQNSCNCAYVFEKKSTGEWLQIQKLTGSDVTGGDNFGRSVSISGNYIIVGAPGRDNGIGAAYIFEHNTSGNWLQVKKIVAPDRSTGDLFGSSVSVSGNYIVVGAPGDADYGTLPQLTGAGSAYFFTNLNGTWELLNKAAPDLLDRSANAGFGSSVAISGTNAVIGAPYEKKDTTGLNPLEGAGAAYAFKRNLNGAMQLVHKIVNWDRATGDQFGYAVSINGNTLMVGAPFEDEDARQEKTLLSAGSVYVFEKKSDNNWWWVEKLIPTDRATGDNFGMSISFSGNTAVIGAATADEAVGSLSSTGAAYIFSYDANRYGWSSKQTKIVATDRAANDWFGYSVAADNDNVLIGAPFQDRNQTRVMATDAGAIYVFGKTACAAASSSISPTTCKTYTSPSKKYTWTRSGTYKDTVLNKAGCDSIITINLAITGKADTSVTVKGKALTANAKDASYNWIDCKTNQPINITTRTLIVTVNGSYKVNIDQDGCVGTSSCHNVVMIAKPDSTSIVTAPPIVLPRNASVQKPFLEVNKLVARDRNHNKEFGQSVAISGNYAVIGSSIDDDDADGKNPANDAGSAYIFTLDDSGKWKQIQKIVANDRTPGANFGWSVAISGNYIVVGALYDPLGVNGSSSVNAAGSAYIFQRSTNGTWYQVQKIIANPTARDGQNYFGYSVAIDDNTIVVGAKSHSKDSTDRLESNINDAGALFVFQLTDAGWIQTQKLLAKDRMLGDWLGNSVAICGDNIIAGAWGSDWDVSLTSRKEAAGAAYIFERKGIHWVQTQKLVADDRTPYDEFGCSVSISGNYAVVGARRTTETADENLNAYTGNAYVFKRNNTGGWSQIQKINPEDRMAEDYLGASVGISGDYLIVSAPGQDKDSLGNYMSNAGAVYVYYLDKKGNWIQTDKVSATEKHELDGLGYAAAISDCNIIATSIVDAMDEEDKNPLSNAGSAYVFTAAGCKNNGKCNATFFPQDKTPRDRQVKDSSKAKMPGKVQSSGLNGKGNDVSIDNQALNDGGLVQPINSNGPKPKTDSVKSKGAYNPKTIQLCIDKIKTDSLPPRPPSDFYRFVPKINPDGTVEPFPGMLKQELSALTDKMWNPGDVITVGFYPNQTSNFVINKVKQFAVVWENIANIRFRFVPTVTGANVRVGFDTTDGSWSWIGRDVLLNTNAVKTMNFGWFSDTTSDEEFSRTVIHEFGHAIGFIHEHQAPTGDIPWDKDKVYSYFGSSPNNWSKDKVDQQIFAKYSKTETNSSIYDSRSIMHYYFPPELTRNGFSFTKNTRLSSMDSAFIKIIYPLPFNPADAKGILNTGDDCDEIVFEVTYNAAGVATNEVDFILAPGIDHHGNWVIWWKKIGIPLKGGGEAALEIQDKSISNRKFNISLIDNTRGMTFWKAKLFGVHTLLNYEWPVFPALIGGCRVRLTWRRDTCL